VVTKVRKSNEAATPLDDKPAAPQHNKRQRRYTTNGSASER